MVINPKHVSEPVIKLNGAVIDTTRQERHLGIERTPSNSANSTIESRINKATVLYGPPLKII